MMNALTVETTQNEKASQATNISVIIPTLNEEHSLPRLIRFLRGCPDAESLEIIVVDGKSTDGTLDALRQFSGVIVTTANRSRAAQMNAGAKVASSSILYFLHADSYPPSTFVSDILTALRNGSLAGSYRLKFDLNHWFLNFNAWFTRFAFLPFCFGDQSLFIEKRFFQRVGGFAPIGMMEDHEIVSRIKRITKFTVLRKNITTSARKYLKNGVFRLQAAFAVVYVLYYLGFSQPRLDRIYRKLIREAR